MPPRAQRDPSTSETEGHGSTANPNSRASTKARNAAAQAAQAELIARHVHSNGPQDQPLVDPMDFESLPDETLRKYRDTYKLPVKSSLTMSGYMLASDVGKSSYSFKARDRVTKPELASAVKKHFNNVVVKESEVITNFLYKVNNENKAFKLNFKG